MTKREDARMRVHLNLSTGTKLCELAEWLGCPDTYHRDGRLMLTAKELAIIVAKTAEDRELAKSALLTLSGISEPA